MKVKVSILSSPRHFDGHKVRQVINDSRIFIDLEVAVDKQERLAALKGHAKFRRVPRWPELSGVQVRPSQSWQGLPLSFQSTPVNRCPDLESDSCVASACSTAWIHRKAESPRPDAATISSFTATRHALNPAIAGMAGSLTESASLIFRLSRGEDERLEERRRAPERRPRPPSIPTRTSRKEMSLDHPHPCPAAAASGRREARGRRGGPRWALAPRRTGRTTHPQEYRARRGGTTGRRPVGLRPRHRSSRHLGAQMP